MELDNKNIFAWRVTPLLLFVSGLLALQEILHPSADTQSFSIITHKHSKSGHLSVQVEHTLLSGATERPAVIWTQPPFQSIPASVSAWDKHPEKEYDRIT